MSVLSKNLDELFHWLESIGLPPPSRDVRIVEIKKGITNLDDRGRFHVRQDELRQPSDYEARFEELLQMGFSWLNLSCCGVTTASWLLVLKSRPTPLYRGLFVPSS
jgi:hypothetical protein